MNLKDVHFPVGWICHRTKSNGTATAGDCTSSYAYDPHTILTHYQLRPYSPPLGRFLPRDPIDERGVGVNSRTYATYDRIYREIPFDVTTNLASGLQVKYLTTDGEVLPTND